MTLVVRRSRSADRIALWRSINVATLRGSRSMRVFTGASFEREPLRETRYLSLIPACDVKRINPSRRGSHFCEYPNTKARIRECSSYRVDIDVINLGTPRCSMCSMRSVFLPLDISESVPFPFTSNKFVFQLKLRTLEKRSLLHSFSSGNSPFTLFTVNLSY